MAFSLKSSAFTSGKPIPSKYARDGGNLSPPLEWSDAPPETQSFMLMVDDPDAPSGTFHHWCIYNIAPERTLLPEGVGHGAKTESLGVAVNDFGNPHYDGPQPPKGHGPHHYHFHIAALDVPTIKEKPNANVMDMWNTARSHILAEAELVGIYSR